MAAAMNAGVLPSPGPLYLTKSRTFTSDSKVGLDQGGDGGETAAMRRPTIRSRDVHSALLERLAATDSSAPPVLLDRRLVCAAIDGHAPQSRHSTGAATTLSSIGAMLIKLVSAVDTFTKSSDHGKKETAAKLTNQCWELRKVLHGRAAMGVGPLLLMQPAATDQVPPPHTSDDGSSTQGQRQMKALLGAAYWSNVWDIKGGGLVGARESPRQLDLHRGLSAAIVLIDRILRRDSDIGGRCGWLPTGERLRDGAATLTATTDDPVELMWGHVFADKSWLETARRRPHPKRTLHQPDNDAVEFLGDSVLDLLSIHLATQSGVTRSSSLSAVDMSRCNDAVSNEALALHMWRRLTKHGLAVEQVLRMAEPPECVFQYPPHGGLPKGLSRERVKQLADLYEVFVGATFLDAGMSLQRVWEVVGADFVSDEASRLPHAQAHRRVADPHGMLPRFMRQTAVM
ncbi:unnamed protein product [Vitrella brassicaformis CCMP3155]|uniref:RNase III domain-containing protein n=1 Tax=Vitrella brassicaformis (strain CCMP3155) TaxID=1169540 RepID=A0A0G4GJI8_VITBC|nr:unnamed protein product [Vitrella brassicaformis CCMP3155]|eukprot:CEM30082.1 unnamed protein product [Vitrella brassicaformis CCMP3155]